MGDAALVEVQGGAHLREAPSPSAHLKLPDAPLLVSGIVGGPLVIFSLTPFRNALTLGSRDRTSSMLALYRKTFRAGLRSGWTGGVFPAVVACPQFLMLGPAFHTLNGACRSAAGLREGDGHAVLPAAAAALGAGLLETVITYGSQSRNAQMAYNEVWVSHASVLENRPRAVLSSPLRPWGPGAVPMLLRNGLGIVGIRAASPWLQGHLPEQLGPNARASVSDVLSSLCVCSLTGPLNQVFNFVVTSPAHAQRAPLAERARDIRAFLQETYLVRVGEEGGWLDPTRTQPLGQRSEPRYLWRLTPTAFRDVGMRSLYVATAFSAFAAMERAVCGLMRDS